MLVEGEDSISFSHSHFNVKLFNTMFRPALGPTQAPIQRVSGVSFAGGKSAGA